MSLQCEIQNMIDHYTDLVQELKRAIAMTSYKGHESGTLIARMMAYEEDMLPDLRSLLQVAEARQSSYLPEQHKAQIIIKDEDGETVYGTYDFNSKLEKAAVNELARKLRDFRKVGVEVRKV